MILKNADYILVNSYRGYDFLNKYLKREIFYLSEYINESYLNININYNDKKNIVVYNPKKGYKFTLKIIKKMKNITFIPIINMNRNEVINLLKTAKVYIDFGNHPGKDRLPREAASLYCCIITGTRGSAGNDKDVPIPNKYKFEDKKKNIKYIINTIYNCINNYNYNINDFEFYRNYVRNEKYIFEQSIDSIFKKES